MKSYAYYDKDGKIIKIIYSTNFNIIKKNRREGENIIRVPYGMKSTRRYKVEAGKIVEREASEIVPEISAPLIKEEMAKRKIIIG